MRKLIGCGLIAGLVAGALGTTSPAHAETVMLMLDQSGSMIYEGQSAGSTRWDDTTSAAAGWIDYYRDNGDSSNDITIWGFEDGSTNQLWPKVAGDCTAAPVNGSFVAITTAAGALLATACRMDRVNSAEGYINLATMISDNGDGDGVMGAIYSQFPPPAGAWTNLADGMCDLLDKMDRVNGKKSIILESDGNENWSSNTDSPCAGTVAEIDADFDWTAHTSEPDWGFDSASWNAKVLRAAVRYPETLANAIYVNGDGVTPRVLTVADYANFQAGQTADLAWKVDVHYSVCASDFEDTNGNGLNDECVPFVYPADWVEQTSLMSFFIMGGGGTDQGNATLFPVVDSAGNTAEFVDIPLGELALFQAITTGSPRSTYREVVRIEGVEYGQYHAIPADVDDSGCADQADLQIIMQPDVYGKAAVEPNQLAIRADINRDGWVNVNDREMLLSATYWGEGCVNVAPHPEGGASCWNLIIDGGETDSDCGGDFCNACSAGGTCVIDDDCVDYNCIDGICGGPVSTCTEATAIDLGAPGTSMTVANNACVKIDDGVPTWWDTRKALVQTQGGGTYPVPFSWRSECTGSSGTGSFTGSWQSTVLNTTSESCATLIQLQGSGGNVKLVYYGQ